MSDKGIVLVLPSLTSGGMERVMAQLANTLVKRNLKVTLLLLSKKERFYDLDPSIKVVEPGFTIDQMPRVVFQLRDFLYLRKQLRKLSAPHILSFGGKYNAFVLLASLGFGKKVFISDRSRPNISYGRFLDFLNPLVYRWATGIVAQTEKAKKVLYQQTGHSNIQVINNPIRPVKGDHSIKNPIILNVGRFIHSKHQDWLMNYFAELDTEGWELIFLGEGPTFKNAQEHAQKKTKQQSITVKGSVANVDDYYQSAAIFAFTSTSEGFPNALGEAMAAGCACISFDCEAGPSDLIDDGKNGFLIPEGDHGQFKEKLQLLMNDSTLRAWMGKEAQEKIKDFKVENITRQYLDIMFSGS